MVDFQSRDTSRGLDDEDESAEAASEPADESGSTHEDESGSTQEDESGPTPEDESVAADATDARTADAGSADGTATDSEGESSPAAESPLEPPAGTSAGATDGQRVAILITEQGADAAADAVAAAMEDHEVLGRDTRTEDLDAVQTAVNTFIDQDRVDAVVTVGGVGVGLTQITVGAVEPLLDARLPGFGELFRRRQEQRDGSAALRTRAFAGIAASTPVFCLPADPEDARTATAELVAPELGALVAAAGEG